MNEGRFRFGVSSQVMPLAEVCPEAGWLARNGTPLELWRECMRFGIKGATSAPHMLSYRGQLRMLSDVMGLHVDHAVNDIVEDMKLHVIPDMAVWAPTFTTAPYGPIEGTLIVDGYIEGEKHTRPVGGDFDMDIVGSVDHAWVTTPGNPDEGPIAVVLQHELARFGKQYVDGLDLAVAGLAWAASRNVDRMQLGRCYHFPTKPPVYEWSPIFDEDAMANYWSRASRALMRPHVAAPGDHCERCPVRVLCAQWQYPILIDGTTPLKTLTERVDAKSYPKLKGMVGAMRHVVGIAEAKLRTYEREGRG